MCLSGVFNSPHKKIRFLCTGPKPISSLGANDGDYGRIERGSENHKVFWLTSKTPRSEKFYEGDIRVE